MTIVRNKLLVDRFNYRITYIMLLVTENAPVHLLKNFAWRMNGRSNYFTVTYKRLHSDAENFYVLLDVRSLSNDVDSFEGFIDMISTEWDKEEFSVLVNDTLREFINERQE